MEQTLVLNSTYEPLQVIPWKRALRMLFLGKVEVLAEYEREIHSVSVSMRLPSVLRLNFYVSVTVFALAIAAFVWSQRRPETSARPRPTAPPQGPKMTVPKGRVRR